ncbi:MAG TPA: pilus assembly protein [Candidatus Brocadiia bacterium]|nr:pilus assembly protein [Candidatus Brocadiia bacterium]
MNMTRFRAKKEKGQAVVELALTLPVVLMLLLGAIDLSRYFFYYEIMTETARDTARRGCLRGITGPDLAAYGNRRLTTMGFSATAPHFVLVTVSARDGGSMNYINFADAQSGDMVQAEAQCRFDTAFGTLIPGLEQNMTIRARSIYIME